MEILCVTGTISGSSTASWSIYCEFFSFMQVEKIFGPGNQYVTAAKMILQVWLLELFKKLYYFWYDEVWTLLINWLPVVCQNSEAMISIDMPAGPSEVLVIADKYANPVHVAADLLSQVLLDSRLWLTMLVFFTFVAPVPCWYPKCNSFFADL